MWWLPTALESSLVYAYELWVFATYLAFLDLLGAPPPPLWAEGEALPTQAPSPQTSLVQQGKEKEGNNFKEQ